MNLQKNSQVIPASLDAEENWVLLKEGRIEGLEGVYRLIFNDLLRFGMSLVPEKDFIKDCIQDLFLDLWKYHKNLMSTDNVKLYLFKALSNRINKEKKKIKIPTKDAEWKELENFYFVHSMEAELIKQQQTDSMVKKLAIGIEKLPFRQREIIQYLFFENLTYEQCSLNLGINLRSVYTLAWKAINNLKKHVTLILMFLSISIR